MQFLTNPAPALADFDVSHRLVSDDVRTTDGERRQATVVGLQFRVVAGDDTPIGRVRLLAAPYAALPVDRNSRAGNRVHHEEGTFSGAAAPTWAYIGEALAEWQPRSDINVRLGLQAMETPFLEPDQTRIFSPNFRGARLRYNWERCRTLTIGRADATIPRGELTLRPLQTAGAGTAVDALNFVSLEMGCLDAVRFGWHVGHAKGAWNQYLAMVDLPMEGVGFAKATLTHTRPQGRLSSGGIGSAASAAMAFGSRQVYLRIGLQWIGRGRDFDWLAETDGNMLANAYAGDYNLAGERSLQLRVHRAPAVMANEWLGAAAWYTQGRRDAEGRQASNREFGLRLFSRPLTVEGVGTINFSFVHVRYRRSADYPGLSYDRTQLSVSMLNR